MVCAGDPADVAEPIIRYTVSNSKKAMKRTRLETDKRHKYSFAPICVRPNYERVFITDIAGIAETLRIAECEQEFTDYFVKHLNGLKATGHDTFDIEVHPTRYFVNPQGDLLKFTTLYDTVKTMMKYKEPEKAQNFKRYDIKYHILVSKKFERLAKLYNWPVYYTVVSDDLIKEIMENGTDY
jgi:hypothetical protein